MGEECRGVIEGGADVLHLDVMDGHFVPNLTMGPDMCRAMRRAFADVMLDVHLMVTDPGRYVDLFAAAGANHLTFHVEVAPGREALRLAEAIRAKGMTAGLAVNPPTSMDAVKEVLELGGAKIGRGGTSGQATGEGSGLFDLILVMSVNPGFSGQAFIEPTLEKTRVARGWVGSGVRVEMDGGVGPDNTRRVREAGCDVLVAASAIFGQPPDRRAGVITRLREG